MTDGEQKAALDSVASFLRMLNGPWSVSIAGWTISGRRESTEHNLILVAAELDAAEKKHPKFVDELIPQRGIIHPPQWSVEELDAARWRLDRAKNGCRVNFRNVLECEVCEAIDAYAHGDLDHARQELAQCAAVCIRGMEYIEREMEAKK